MTASVETIRKVWTEAELQALPDDGYLHEVVGGELVMSPKNNWYHGLICTRLLAALSAHVTAHRLGAVLDSSTGFWMQNRNCRAPDVSFVTRARIAALGLTPKDKRFFPGAPDLAIEVLSASTSRAEMDSRLKDFFSSGCRLAWIINPETESVEVCHSLMNRILVGPGGTLDGEDVLPGFSYPIASLFKDWDWD